MIGSRPGNPILQGHMLGHSLKAQICSVGPFFKISLRVKAPAKTSPVIAPIDPFFNSGFMNSILLKLIFISKIWAEPDIALLATGHTYCFSFNKSLISESNSISFGVEIVVSFSFSAFLLSLLNILITKKTVIAIMKKSNIT